MASMQNCIHLSDTVFRWPNSNSDTLNIPHLSLSVGESLFIHGPSGSGKTTLLNLITGVLTPNRGTIEILGKNIGSQKSSWRDQFRVDHFGIIFQQFNLIPYLTVFENVMLPCTFSARRKTRIEVDKKTLLAEARRLLETLGFVEDEINKRNVTELSTGQQQRVAAARALLGSPEIIIADEPTSALDADNKHVFLKLLFQETKHAGSTLVFVSHDRSLSKLFDQVLSLESINLAA